jgi:hypothetical protein
MKKKGPASEEASYNKNKRFLGIGWSILRRMKMSRFEMLVAVFPRLALGHIVRPMP